VSLDEVSLHPVRIPMIVRFRRVTWREAILLEGPAGWGEFSPFPDYPPGTTSRWLAAALESAVAERPIAQRTSIPVNVTVPAIDPEKAFQLVSESHCRTAKVKIADTGESRDTDLARVAAVRDALGNDGRLRVDVNAAWSVDEAAERINELDWFDLEYVEQPVATIEEMIELRRRISVPIAADEVVRQAADPMDVVEREAADLLVLKVQPLGGVQRTLDLAERSGMDVVISSALETSVGLAAGIRAAASLPSLPFDCGLATAVLLAGDVTTDPLLPIGGAIEVREVTPDPDLLDEWQADPETERRLLRRLRQAAETLT
jgi:O-succinylbenzoate synthase